MRWAAWQPLDAAEIVDAPFQVRIASGLVEYPRGKSAMVFYGAGQRLLAAFRAAHAGEGLLVRFPSGAEISEADPAEIRREIDRFTERFGAPPQFNEELPP